MCSHLLPASAANAQGKVQLRTDPDVQDANACHAGSKIEDQEKLSKVWQQEKGLTSLLEPRGFCCCCCCCCCCCSMTATRRWAATDARATISGAGCFCGP